MLVKLNQILLFGLVTMGIAFLLYPIYIKFLRNMKAGQSIRSEDVSGKKSTIFTKLHKHKAGTPTMGGALFLVIMFLMVGVSFLIYKLWYINHTLLNRQETYIILFGFFSMGLIWVIDDYLNIKWKWAKKGLSVKWKLIGMFVFAAFISRWFYVKLWISYVNLRPIAGKIDIGIFFPILTFFLTIAITNAINIVDWLDWLAWWLMSMVLFGLSIITFYNQTFFATTVLIIVLISLMVFTFYNIFPAKVFMWDSWALALWWLVCTTLFLLNMRIGIFIPFAVLFLLFIIDIGSVWLQIFWKKIFKKKLFPIAPIHHYLEYKGKHETTIVMKAWFLQLILLSIFIVMMFYQIELSPIIT